MAAALVTDVVISNSILTAYRVSEEPAGSASALSSPSFWSDSIGKVMVITRTVS